MTALAFLAGAVLMFAGSYLVVGAALAWVRHPRLRIGAVGVAIVGVALLGAGFLVTPPLVIRIPIPWPF